MHILNPYRFAAAGGGVVVEAYASTNSGASVTDQLFTAPAGITSGELLILNVVSNAVRSAPSGWTTAFTFSASGINQHIFWKVSDGTETDVTITGTGYFCGWYYRISGADTSDPFNVFGNPWTSLGTQGTALEATTTIDGCLVFFIAGFDGADGGSFGFVSGTDWSIESEELIGTSSLSNSACFGYKILATAGATSSVIVSKSVSDGWANRQFAVAPA